MIQYANITMQVVFKWKPCKTGNWCKTIPWWLIDISRLLKIRLWELTVSNGLIIWEGLTVISEVLASVNGIHMLYTVHFSWMFYRGNLSCINCSNHLIWRLEGGSIVKKKLNLIKSEWVLISKGDSYKSEWWILAGNPSGWEEQTLLPRMWGR